MRRGSLLRYHKLVDAGARSIKAGSLKSGSGSFSPDKQKLNGLGRRTLLITDRLTFDLEGLATATRQLRHLRVKRTNVAQRLPREKRAAYNGNQHFQKQQSLRKQSSIISLRMHVASSYVLQGFHERIITYHVLLHHLHAQLLPFLL